MLGSIVSLTDRVEREYADYQLRDAALWRRAELYERTVQLIEMLQSGDDQAESIVHVDLGCGGADLLATYAKSLLQRNFTKFCLIGVDANQYLLQRGREAIETDFFEAPDGDRRLRIVSYNTGRRTVHAGKSVFTTDCKTVEQDLGEHLSPDGRIVLLHDDIRTSETLQQVLDLIVSRGHAIRSMSYMLPGVTTGLVLDGVKKPHSIKGGIQAERTQKVGKETAHAVLDLAIRNLPEEGRLYTQKRMVAIAGEDDVVLRQYLENERNILGEREKYLRLILATGLMTREEVQSVMRESGFQFARTVSRGASKGWMTAEDEMELIGFVMKRTNVPAEQNHTA